MADEGDMDMNIERLLKQHNQLSETTPRVLEINPDAPPDAIPEMGANNKKNSNSNNIIIATTLSCHDNNNEKPPVYVGSLIPTLQNDNEIVDEERFDASTFSNLYGNPALIPLGNTLSEYRKFLAPVCLGAVRFLLKCFCRCFRCLTYIGRCGTS